MEMRREQEELEARAAIIREQLANPESLKALIIDELKDAWAKAGWGNSHFENVPTSNFVHNISKTDAFHTIVLEFKPDFISGQDLGNEMHFTQTIMIFVPTTNTTVWTLLQSLVNAYAA